MPTQTETIFKPSIATVEPSTPQFVEFTKPAPAPKPKEPKYNPLDFSQPEPVAKQRESKPSEFPKINNTASSGMLKEAPKAPSKTVLINPSTQEAVSTTEGWNGIPFAIYRHFNVDFSKEEQRNITQLKEVYDWAKSGSKDTGDAIKKIANLERKLGAPRIGETRYSKLYNWVLLNRNINNLLKQQGAIKS